MLNSTFFYLLGIVFMVICWFVNDNESVWQVIIIASFIFYCTAVIIEKIEKMNKR